ncbi:MAG: sugar transferase [Desulfobacterales bacterium]
MASSHFTEAPKRFWDLFFSGLVIFPAALLGLVIAMIIHITSQGPVLYWSRRVGRDNTLFLMPKFRTMRPDTPAVATHLLKNPERWITLVGKLLRRLSLDELPQLYSVLKGDMSLVGPRPALFNQDDLIALRTQKGIHRLRPGITGWAQVNGRDDLPIPVKVQYDEEYLKKRSLRFDLKILLLTIIGCLKGKGVAH